MLNVHTKNSLRRTKRRLSIEIKLRDILIDKYPIQNEVRANTIARCTAEISMRSAFSFAMSIMPTHFILGKSLNNQNLNQFPTKHRQTIDLVSKLNIRVPCVPMCYN